MPAHTTPAHPSSTSLYSQQDVHNFSVKVSYVTLHIAVAIYIGDICHNHVVVLFIKYAETKGNSVTNENIFIVAQ